MPEHSGRTGFASEFTQMQKHLKDLSSRTDPFNYTALKQKPKHLDVINELAVQLLAVSSLDDILSVIAKTAITKLGFEDCVIYLIDKDSNALIQRASHRSGEVEDVDELTPSAAEVVDHVISQVAASSKAHVVDDTRLETECISQDKKQLSKMAVPILHNNGVIGVIDSEHTRTSFFTPEHVDVVSTIAAMSATKIANAIDNEQLEAFHQQEALSKQLYYEASHDSLTGLLNRREFERRLARCMDEFDPSITRHVICYIDVNDFKKINDTNGHAAGDSYLKKIASLISENISNDDLCARVGGDEFNILFMDTDIDRARETCQTICDLIKGSKSRRYSDANHAQLSMGLYVLDSDNLTMSDVMARAGTACYAAKKHRFSAVCDYAEIRDHVAIEKAEMSLVHWFRSAIEDNLLRLHAQEIFPSGDTGGKPGLEILLRPGTDAPDIGSISKMLRSAERHGLSTRLDYWVISHVLAWIQENRELLLKSLSHVAVNLSVESIENASFQNFLLDEIQNASLPEKFLCIEVTENMPFTDIETTASFIDKLRQSGCLVALDDFGSGLTSYDYLRHLSIDIIKIDGLFVRSAQSDPKELAMMLSIKDLAHSLGMQTVAEQVENAATLALVANAGIDFAQGFFLSKPVELDLQIKRLSEK